MEVELFVYRGIDCVSVWLNVSLPALHPSLHLYRPPSFLASLDVSTTFSVIATLYQITVSVRSRIR